MQQKQCHVLQSIEAPLASRSGGDKHCQLPPVSDFIAHSFLKHNIDGYYLHFYKSGFYLFRFPFRNFDPGVVPYAYNSRIWELEGKS